MSLKARRIHRKKNVVPTVRTFVKYFINETFHLDGRIFATVSALILKPGHLTASYFNRQKHFYIDPLKLYFAVNFIFFLLMPLLSTSTFVIFGYTCQSFTQDAPHRKRLTERQISESGLPEPVYEERFNGALKYNQPAFVFIMIPMLALYLKLFYIRQRRFYVEHLIFSMHLYAVFLLGMLFSLLITRAMSFLPEWLSGSPIDPVIVLLILFFTLFLIYLFFAVQRYYRQHWAVGILKTILLFTGFWINLACYSFLLFYQTLFVLRFSY